MRKTTKGKKFLAQILLMIENVKMLALLNPQLTSTDIGQRCRFRKIAIWLKMKKQHKILVENLRIS